MVYRLTCYTIQLSMPERNSKMAKFTLFFKYFTVPFASITHMLCLSHNFVFSMYLLSVFIDFVAAATATSLTPSRSLSSLSLPLSRRHRHRKWVTGTSSVSYIVAPVRVQWKWNNERIACRQKRQCTYIRDEYSSTGGIEAVAVM